MSTSVSQHRGGVGGRLVGLLHPDNTPSRQQNNDAWAVIPFLGAVGFVLYRSLVVRRRQLFTEFEALNVHDVAWILSTVGLLFIIPYATLILLSKYPKQFPLLAFWAIAGTIGVFALMTGEITVIGVFAVLAFILMPRTTETRAMMIAESCRVNLSYKPLFTLSGTLNTLVVLFGAVTILPFFYMFYNNTERYAIEFLFTLFVVIWVFQVRTAFLRSVMDGIAARWYVQTVMSGGSPPSASTPPPSFWLSFWRSLQLFGTLCLCALVNTVTFILHYLACMATEPKKDDGIGAMIFKAILRSVAHYAKMIADIFNEFAITTSTVTSRSYWDAAQESKRIVSNQQSLMAAIQASNGWETVISSAFLSIVSAGALGLGAGASPMLMSMAVMANVTVASASVTSFSKSLFVCMSESRREAIAAGGQQPYHPIIDRLERDARGDNNYHNHYE